MSIRDREIAPEENEKVEMKTLTEWEALTLNWVKVSRRAFSFMRTAFRDRNTKWHLERKDVGQAFDYFVVGDYHSLQFLSLEIADIKIERGDVEMVRVLVDSLRKAEVEPNAASWAEKVC